VVLIILQICGNDPVCCSFLLLFPWVAALVALLSVGPFFCRLPDLRASLSPLGVASGVTKATGHLPCPAILVFIHCTGLGGERGQPCVKANHFFFSPSAILARVLLLDPVWFSSFFFS
jgi:hypothetical protein